MSGEMRMVFTLCSIFFNSRGKDDESKQCYTLESILFLLKNVKLPHPLYVSRAIVSRFSGFLLVLCYYTVTVLRHYSVQIYVIFLFTRDSYLNEVLILLACICMYCQEAYE